MHVTHIDLLNFKTVGEFKKDFSGGVYLVTGENETGKSTILSAIVTLLTGSRSDNLLKIGEEKGHAKITVGEAEDSYDVELRFSEKNPRGTITIEKVGTGFKSGNISTLSSTFNYQDFDAHEFAKWSDTAEGRRKQVEVVKSLLPEKVQQSIKDIENDVLQTKEKRKEVNAEVKSLTGILDRYGVTPNDITTYSKPISVSELADKKSEAAAHNSEVERSRGGIKVMEETLEGTPGKIKDIEDTTKAEVDAIDYQIQVLKKKREDALDNENVKRAEIKKEAKLLRERIKNGKKWISENPIRDIDHLSEQIQEAEGHNEKCSKVSEYLNRQKEVKKATAEQDKMNKHIEDRLQEREALIDSAKLPIKGLDFTDDGLTLNGVPFRYGEVSTSQEMEVAAKLIIAKNPTVKVFKIAQGESLGKDRLNSIVKFATDNGYQGFIEEVHRGQTDLIVEEYKLK